MLHADVALDLFLVKVGVRATANICIITMYPQLSLPWKTLGGAPWICLDFRITLQP